MPFTVKNWVDAPSTTTPLSAAALEDLETRVTDYADSIVPGAALTKAVKTADYTLVLTDAGKLIVMNVASLNFVTIPTNASQAFPVGSIVGVMQYGAGQTQFAVAGGVTPHGPGGAYKLATQYAMAVAYKYDTNEWILAGNIIA